MPHPVRRAAVRGRVADLGDGATLSVVSTPVRPRRRSPLQKVIAIAVMAFCALVLAQLILSLLNNRNIDFGAIAHYQFAPTILSGVGVTLLLTVIAMLLGIVLGVVLAVMATGTVRPLRWLSGAYVWFFRGVPVLVQLIFWFNLGLVFHTLSLGLPFGPTLVRARTNTVISGFTAAILGLGLNEGAYMAEIVRAGLLSVSHGQTEAARALGMRNGQVLRLVVLPQALRVVVPPTGNEVINMLKVTSLVSVIGGGDLLSHAEYIYSSNFLVPELIVVATVWYLVMTTVATIGQGYLERRLAGGSSGATVRVRQTNLVERLLRKA